MHGKADELFFPTFRITGMPSVGIPIGAGINLIVGAGGEGEEIAPVAHAVAAAVALHLHLVGGFRGKTVELNVGGGSGGRLPRFFGTVDGEIIDVKEVLIITVEVAEGHIARLAGVSAQINGELLPVASRQSPFVDGHEIGCIRVSRSRDGNTEMLVRVVRVLCFRPKTNRSAQGHLGRYQIVVGVKAAFFGVITL